MAATAKIFMHGRSQAVRLPKEFRLPGKEVRVSKVGDKVISSRSSNLRSTSKLGASGSTRSAPAISCPRVWLTRRPSLLTAISLWIDGADVLSRHQCGHLRDQYAAAKNRRKAREGSRRGNPADRAGNRAL